MKWCDLLRVKSEFPINLWPNAVQAYHRWIRTCIKENVPYDRFVPRDAHRQRQQFPQAAGELLPRRAEPGAAGHRPGRGAELHGRAAGKLAQGAVGGHGGLLLADRLQAHRSNGKRRSSCSISRRPQPKRASRRCRAAVFPDGTPAQLSPGQDPREAFADWLITPEESLVHPEHRQPRLVLAAGPRHHPSGRRHPAGQSARQSRAAGVPGAGSGRGPYDLKHLFRQILNSTTYQLSSMSPGARIPGARRISPSIRCAAWRRRC